MELWQEIRKNSENGARRLVSEYGNRLYGASGIVLPAVFRVGYDQYATYQLWSWRCAAKYVRSCIQYV